MTNSELIAFNARQRLREIRHDEFEVPEGCSKESDLHEEIRKECARRGWIALHGAMHRSTARSLGEYDFTIQADGGRTFFVECKTKTGKLSVEQNALHSWARKLGHTVHVVRSLEEFLKVIQ